jgi:hypothetical protein
MTDAVGTRVGPSLRRGGGPLFHGHGRTSVASNATSDLAISICRYGLPT